jgi:hypothetical protein
MRANRAIRIAAPLGLAAMLLALTACGRGDTLERLGLRIPPPDEFQVIEHKPLVVPPSATLPEPHPGAASPLDPDPHRDAKQALFGTGGGSVVASVPPSPGEQVLLNAADASVASNDIRVQLTKDKAETAANKPYEPPNLGELFGGRKKEKIDEAEVLEPQAEAERLQRKGVATPVNPNPEVAEEKKSTTGGETYLPKRQCRDPFKCE